MKWADWKGYFLNYLSTLEDEGDEAFSSKRRKKILLNNLGPEGLRVYENMVKKPRAATDQDEFQHALDDLDGHYQPVVCTAIDRYNFFQLKQSATEKVEDYVAAL